MPSKIGIHALPYHGVDWEAWTLMQPTTFKVFDAQWNNDSQDFMRELFKRLPNTLFLMRDWPASEEKYGPDDLFANPVVCAKRHAASWNHYADKFGWRAKGWTKQMVFLGVNEPNTYQDIQAIKLYWLTFAREMTNYGLSAGLFNFSVGHPPNKGKDTPADWSVFEEIRKEIARAQALGITHYAILHEYWRDLIGPNDPQWFRWHIGRVEWLIQQWPEVKIVIGEAGYDYALERPWADNEGWMKHYPREGGTQLYWEHMVWLDLYYRRFPQIIGWMPFSWDSGDRKWWSFRVDETHRQYFIQYAQEQRNVPDPVMTQPTPTPDIASALKNEFGSAFEDLRGKLPVHEKLHYSRRSLNEITDYVIHHSGPGTSAKTTWKSIAVAHINADPSRGKAEWPGIGYTVGIDTRSGKIKVSLLNDLETVSHHAGDANRRGLGICVMGNFENGVEPSLLDLEALRRVIKALDGFLKRQPRLTGHRDWMDRTCPGALYPLVTGLRGISMREKLIAEAEKRQVLRLNPNAALQKKIFADGFVPTSPEFEFTDGGRVYVCQRAERLDTGAVRVYYCAKGQWNQVWHVDR